MKVYRAYFAIGCYFIALEAVLSTRLGPAYVGLLGMGEASLALGFTRRAGCE